VAHAGSLRRAQGNRKYKLGQNADVLAIPIVLSLSKDKLSPNGEFRVVHLGNLNS